MRPKCERQWPLDSSLNMGSLEELIEAGILRTTTSSNILFKRQFSMHCDCSFAYVAGRYRGIHHWRLGDQSSAAPFQCAPELWLWKSLDRWTSPWQWEQLHIAGSARRQYVLREEGCDMYWYKGTMDLKTGPWASYKQAVDFAIESSKPLDSKTSTRACSNLWIYA